MFPHHIRLAPAPKIINVRKISEVICHPLIVALLKEDFPPPGLSLHSSLLLPSPPALSRGANPVTRVSDISIIYCNNNNMSFSSQVKFWVSSSLLLPPLLARGGSPFQRVASLLLCWLCGRKAVEYDVDTFVKYNLQHPDKYSRKRHSRWWPGSSVSTAAVQVSRG